MARKTKKTVVAFDPKQEIVDDFRRLTVDYTTQEITDLYSFGEPDFDPTAALENACLGLASRYAKLTGLDYDDAVRALQTAAWGWTNYKD